MSGRLTVVDPYDLTELVDLPMTSAAHVDGWLDEAVDRHRAGPASVAERTAWLEAAAGLLAERQEAFALRIAREGGKPLLDARVETSRAVEGIRHAVRVLHTEAGAEVPMGRTPASTGRLAFTSHEPIGPVVAVSAFNHPLNLIVHQAVPAIAVGCPVIVKPAATTPMSCLAFVDLLREAGVPEAACRVALLDDAGAEALVTDRRVAFLSFIGSARVGWMLRGKLAPGVRCALEHGGAAPVIVERDAELDAVVPALVKGGYYHAGQVCVSVQRILVHESQRDALAERLVDAVARLRTGRATDETTDVGPLILPREVDRVDAWVAEARDAGAAIPIGGRPSGQTTYEPTVVIDAPENVRLNRAEVFGPVTSLRSFREPEEALREANGLDVAFQAAVFTPDLDRALFYARRLDASAVMVNDHTAFRVDWMPFGGRRASGLGTGGIGPTMRDMQQERMIVLRSSSLL